MQSGDGQLSLFDHAGWSGKMYQAHSAQDSRPAKIFGSSSKKRAAWQTVPRLYLDLRAGHGSLLGPLWETDFPSLTGQLTPNFSESLKDAAGSTLSQILEASPPQKYYLSPKAGMGILRRADKRGKELPPVLREALEIQAGLRETPDGLWPDMPVAFACNQREKVNCHDVSGVIQAQPGMKQQTFIAAGLCAGASGAARNIGWQEECSSTLKTGMEPAILCLNDQGGNRMDISRDLTGTLRAKMDGHPPMVMATQQGGAEIGVDLCPTITAAAGMSGNNQPIVFDHHWLDARVMGPVEAAQTVTQHYGTGGNNTALVMEPEKVYCIAGNTIDRQPKNGGNGIGVQEDLAYTVTATDRHSVAFSMQRSNEYRENDVAATQSARQYKYATDLICQPDVSGLDCRNLRENGDVCGTLQAKGSGGQSLNTTHPVRVGTLIRRLTPLECERLQGFPDGWTAIPGASDSARYKSLGNSVAIPCVEFVMRGIAAVLKNSEERRD